MHNDTCADGVDDKYAVTPPTGTVGPSLEQFREWDESGPLAAAFTQRGRFVACGEA